MPRLGKSEFTKLAHVIARATGSLHEVVQFTNIPASRAKRNGRLPKMRQRVVGDKLATKAAEGTLGSRNGKGYLAKYQPWKLNLLTPVKAAAADVKPDA